MKFTEEKLEQADGFSKNGKTAQKKDLFFQPLVSIQKGLKIVLI